MKFRFNRFVFAVLVIAISPIVVSCTDSSESIGPEEGLYFPPNDSKTWKTLDPSSLNWCSEKLPVLNDFLNEKNTKAFVILKNGEIALEWYFDAFTQDSIWYWASAGKTLSAFLIGKAQEEGFLSIDDKASDYLGEGWTSLPPAKEVLITIRHQLTMTTGLNVRVSDDDCFDPDCLQYKADAGTRWAYHNAPYTLLGSVIESATGLTRNQYIRTRLSDKIGMVGLWVRLDYNYVYFSNARSMARFGLMILNHGKWQDEFILNDGAYFDQMINSSQDLNPSYGYLWWLNGKGKHMLPVTQIVFNTDIIPNAPDEVYAGLGKNDQKLYIWPSENIVIVRMGNSAGQTMLAASSFDNELWAHITGLVCQ